MPRSRIGASPNERRSPSDLAPTNTRPTDVSRSHWGAAVEIEPTSGVYGYEERYNPGLTNFYAPARIADDAAAVAAETALAAHRALGLRHISRVDLIVDGAGTAWFLEASVMPGLTETSLVPLALEAAGHDLGWVYARLAEAAVADG